MFIKNTATIAAISVLMLVSIVRGAQPEGAHGPLEDREDRVGVVEGPIGVGLVLEELVGPMGDSPEESDENQNGDVVVIACESEGEGASGANDEDEKIVSEAREGDIIYAQVLSFLQQAKGWVVPAETPLKVSRSRKKKFPEGEAWHSRTVQDVVGETCWTVDMRRAMVQKTRQKQQEAQLQGKEFKRADGEFMFFQSAFVAGEKERNESFSADYRYRLDHALLCAADMGDWCAVRGLVECGASIETKAAGARTPLMLAVTQGHVKAMMMLLAAGANIHARDNEGNTPLLIAAQCGTPGMIRTLLELGANKHDVNRMGASLRTLAEARQDNDVLQLLHDYGV